MKRWSGVAGIVFVAFSVISPLVRGSVPGTDKVDAMAKFARFYSDSSHQSQALASAITGVVGLFFFAWFLGGLWSALREAACSRSSRRPSTSPANREMPRCIASCSSGGRL